MTQSEMFNTSFADALRDTVNQLGGAKKVGLMLWPSKTMEAAQRELLQCLDPSKDRKLSLEEIDLLIEAGRKEGIHATAKYFENRFGYRLMVVQPKDELAELNRQTQSKIDELKDLLAKRERAQLRAAS